MNCGQRAIQSKNGCSSEFVQGNEYTQGYKECKKAFKDAARQFGYGEYHVEYYDFPERGQDLSVDLFKSQIQIVDAVQRDIIDPEEPWILEFRQKMEKDVLAKRQQLEKDWKSTQKALLQSFEEYPRNISIGALCYALEDEFYEKSGTYLRLLCLKEPSDRVHNDTLASQTKYFKQAAKALKADEEWVQKIAEEPELSVDEQTPSEVDPEVANSLFFVKLIWTEGERTKSQIFETKPAETAQNIDNLPDSLRQQLVEAARKT